MSTSDLRGRGNADQYGTFSSDGARTGTASTKTYLFAAWTTVPKDKWTPTWNFNTQKGLEWFHLYMWMAKDLAWAQDWYIAGMFFGTAAVLWSAFLLFQTFQIRNYIESGHYIGQFFWLLANYWWMWGEIHDSEYPEEPKTYEDHRFQAASLMLAAFGWLVVYHAVLLPFNLLPTTTEDALAPYADPEIEPHAVLAPLAPTWRSYENLHVLFWLGKDTAWSNSWPIMWWPFAALTVAIAADFVATTSLYPGRGVDHAHYVAQALWVLANLLWAFSELYYGEEDPTPLFPADLAAAAAQPRWWCGWILVAALAVLAAAQAAWAYVSLRPPPSRAKADDLQASR